MFLIFFIFIGVEGFFIWGVYFNGFFRFEDVVNFRIVDNIYFWYGYYCVDWVFG